MPKKSIPDIIETYTVSYIGGYFQWPNTIKDIQMSLMKDSFFFQGGFGSFYIPFCRSKCLKAPFQNRTQIFTKQRITVVRDSFNIRQLFQLPPGVFTIVYMD